MAESFGDTYENSSLLEELIGKVVGPSDLENPETVKYLDNLSSYGVSQLSHEPDRLHDEQNQLLEKTRSLAFKDYRTFIEAANCSREIYKDFNIIEENLESLLDTVPEFSERIESFTKSSQEITTRRKQNSMVLSRLTQLLEILEIPQLMDTCVRNSYYEEGLELTNYVKRLEKKLSSIKIIADIGREVKKATRLMLNQLLQQLKGNVQLPACLRVVGYLRQLEAFTEAELRIKFLQARDSWFQSVISAIPDKDAYYHITKVIEASRVHLFDIVTQYRAIFSDDDPVFVMDDDHNINYANILHAWISRKVTDFMSVLKKDLDTGLASRLDSVFSQCMYFGLSFSRVGADFRSVMIPIFNRTVMKAFVKNLEAATITFEETLATYTASQNIGLPDNPYKTSNVKTTESSLSPPQELLDFPPLAHYTNGILNCLNDLRCFASIPLVKLIRDALQESLERSSLAIASWAKLELQPQLKKSEGHVRQLTSLAVEEFFPYIIRCFQAVFKPAAVSLVFGRSSLVADHSTDSTYSLDIDLINEPLSEYLPEMVAIDQGVEVDIKSGIDEGVEKDELKKNNEDSLSRVSFEDSTENILRRISSSSFDDRTQRTSDILSSEQKLDSRIETREANVS